MTKLLEKKVTIKRNGVATRKSVYGHSWAEIDRKIEALNREQVPMLNELVDDWYESHSANIEHYTAECYIAPMKDIKAEFEGVSANEIKPIDCQRFISKLSAQRYARHTVGLRLTVLRQVFDFAIMQGYIDINPCASVRIPNNTKSARKVSAPSIEDIEKIKANCNTDIGLFALFLLYTGLRREELLALKYEDISDGYIHVNKVVIFKNNQPFIREYTKTVSGMRDVPVLAPLEPYVSGQGYIFNINGQPYSKSQIDKAWARYKRELGIDVTPHQLRHAYATICYDAGLDSKEAQKLLGHSKESVTRDIYTEIRQSRIESASAKLNAYIS